MNEGFLVILHTEKKAFEMMNHKLVSILMAGTLAAGMLSMPFAEAKRKKTAKPTTEAAIDIPAEGHQRINLWAEGTVPNSTGISVSDSIVNHRIWRADQPRLYVYQPVVEERTGTAVVIIPGGGYVKQAYEVSGISMAKWFNTFGVTAFILLHRLPNQPDVLDGSIAPTQDAQRAIRLVRSRAAEFGIDPDKIGVMGTSAGGHVCACVSTITEDLSAIGDSLDAVSFRPDFAILVSPVISMADSITHRVSRDCLLGALSKSAEKRRQFSMDQQVTVKNPPTLLIHAADDPAVGVMNSVSMFEALMRKGVKLSSLHVFPFGKHSIALRRQPGSTALWVDLAESWMKEIGVLKP